METVIYVVIGVVLFVGVLALTRQIWAWIFRIDEVIDRLKDVVQGLKAQHEVQKEILKKLEQSDKGPLQN